MTQPSLPAGAEPGEAPLPPPATPVAPTLSIPPAAVVPARAEAGRGDPIPSLLKDKLTIVVSFTVVFAAGIKLFSVSRGSIGTVAAIIRTTSAGTLVTGTFLSLLPAFVVALTAAVVWWWAESIERQDGATADYRPGTPIFLLLLLGVVDFFLLPFLEYIPMAWAGCVLFGFLAAQYGFPRPPTGRPLASAKSPDGGRRGTGVYLAACIAFVVLYAALAAYVLFVAIPSWDTSSLQETIVWIFVLGNVGCFVFGLWLAGARPIVERWQDAARNLKITAACAAGIIVVVVLLTGTMWLPIERVTLAPSVDTSKFTHIAVGDDNSIGAYVLKADDHGAVLLTETERAVVQLAAGDVESHQLCANQPTGRWGLLLLARPSQILIHDAKTQPYKYCPVEAAP